MKKNGVKVKMSQKVKSSKKNQPNGNINSNNNCDINIVIDNLFVEGKKRNYGLIGVTLYVLLIILMCIFVGCTTLSIYFTFKCPVYYYAILIKLGLMIIDALMMTFLIPMIIKINNKNKEDCYKKMAIKVADAYIEKHKQNASQENNEEIKK